MGFRAQPTAHGPCPSTRSRLTAALGIETPALLRPKSSSERSPTQTRWCLPTATIRCPLKCSPVVGRQSDAQTSPTLRRDARAAADRPARRTPRPENRPAFHDRAPLVARCADPPVPLFSRSEDILWRLTAVVVRMPCAGHLWKARGQTVRHRHPPVPAEWAPVAIRHRVYARLPFVIGAVRALPPHALARRRKQIARREPIVSRRVPERSDARLEISQRGAGEDSAVGAVWASFSSGPCPLRDRREPEVPTIVRAAPPDLAV